MGTKTSQLTKWKPNPSKMKPGGPLRGSRKAKAAAGVEGTKNIYIFDAHLIVFESFSVPLMPEWAPFWAPLDFEGVRK